MFHESVMCAMFSFHAAFIFIFFAVPLAAFVAVRGRRHFEKANYPGLASVMGEPATIGRRHSGRLAAGCRFSRKERLRSTCVHSLRDVRLPKRAN